MDDPITAMVLRHLIGGWRKFVGIIAQATGHGIKLQPDDLDTLERMHEELARVIEKQKTL